MQFEPLELAGTYFHRLTHSYWTLELSENGAYSCSWGACLGETHQSGTWRLEGDTVVLRPEPADSTKEFSRIGSRYVPVKWGNRNLLIEERRMPAFCASVRGQTPPAEAQVDGLDFVKVISAAEVPGEGEPIFSQRFRHFYEAGPIHAKVVRIGSEGTVTLNRGAADCLQVGMRLVPLPTGRGYEESELEVVSVNDHEATAESFYFLYRSERRVQVGDRFTTGEGFCYPYWSKEERLTDLPPPVPKVGIQHRETGEILLWVRVFPETDGIWFGGEDLQGADLRAAAPGSDLRRSLVKAYLSYTNLDRATMAGQDLSEADLSRTHLDGADLTDANLQSARMSEASLVHAALDRANLIGAELQQSDLTGASFTGACLRGAMLCGASLRGTDFTGADLTDAKLTLARYDRQTRWPEGFDAEKARRGPGVSTAVRNHVTFRIPVDRRQELPQGCGGVTEDVGNYLAQQLAQRGVRLVDDYHDVSGCIPFSVGDVQLWHQGFAHGFRCYAHGRGMHVLVGAIGSSPTDDEALWLATVHPLQGSLSRLLGLAGERQCRKVCLELDAVLKADALFTDIRWYTEDAWNSDPDTGWSAAP